MTQAIDEREARKQYVRRRQKVVFSIIGAIMAVVMVISLLFFFHVGGLGTVKTATVQRPTGALCGERAGRFQRQVCGEPQHYGPRA